MNYIDSLKKLISHLIILAFLFIGISCQNSEKLFQEDTKNWNISGDASWVFSNNQLIGSIKEGAGYIMTQESYDNFVLELEFKPDSTINSGVFIRCTNEEISPIDCHEINIWDLHPNQDYRTGSIVMKSVPLVKVETNYKWNRLKIEIIDDHLKVWINNLLTAEHTEDAQTSGYIGLQATGKGEVRFRNIEIKHLVSD